MTWKSRLANSLGKLGIQSETPYMRNNGTSMDVHAIQDAMGGFSQPVWGAEINTVGAYSREGYTSKTRDTPIVKFRTQALAMETDEDVQLAINHLSSKVTGGAHYWKAQDDMCEEHISKFSKQLDFDWFDTILVKELLGYGNSVWKPRLGISNIRNKDDLMQIPISSFVAVWWDRQRRPYKYEFRGAEYQGYHNPQDIIAFNWNPVNGSVIGNGFITALTVQKQFDQITPAGTESNTLPSLLDRKYSTHMTMHIAERRYIPHNVYVAEGANQEERAQLASDVNTLNPGEDFVVGKKVEVQELGSGQRAFDPTLFSDLTQGGIFKALNDFRGKMAQESSHQFANAEESSVLDEIGLASFPLAVTRQLEAKLFKPWYESHPMYSANYGGGLISMPYEECEFELNFGRAKKVDIEAQDAMKLIEIGINSGAIQDPNEIRELLEDHGLGLRKEYAMMLQQQYNPMQPGIPQVMPQQQPYQFDNQVQGNPPMNNPNYNTEGNRFVPERYDGQPSNPRQNFAWTKTQYTKKPQL